MILRVNANKYFDKVNGLRGCLKMEFISLPLDSLQMNTFDASLNSFTGK